MGVNCRRTWESECEKGAQRFLIRLSNTHLSYNAPFEIKYCKIWYLMVNLYSEPVRDQRPYKLVA